MQVSYLPSDPESSRVVSDTHWWAYAIIASGVFVVLYGLGTFLLRLLALFARLTLMRRGG